MRTTVNIDDDLLAEVKQVAALGHRTIDSVLDDAIGIYAQPSTPEQATNFCTVL